MYSVYLFDFDYTLGDSTNGIVESVNYALAKMNLPLYSRDVIRSAIGLALPETFTYLTHNGDPRQRELFSKLFIEKAGYVMAKNTELYPDSIKVLSYLRAKGLRTGIVTTKNHSQISQILDKFAISHLFDTVVGNDDVEHPKPHPEPLLAAMSLLGAQPRDVMYVGDSTIDAEAAQGAGIDFIAVTTGATKQEALQDYPHIAVISSLSELLDIVTR